MKIPFSSDYIPGKLRSIPRPVMAAMISALVIGVICHFQALTQQMVNHDTVTTIGDDGMWLLAQGKWFFGYIASLRGHIATSGIESTCALLLLSLCAGLTASVLRIRTTLHAALVGAILVSFPSVFSNMLYLGEDTFYTALFMATLAVYLTIKYKFGFLAGIVLLTLSTGTYQAYIGYSAGLFVLVSILDILENKKKPKEILINGLKFLGVLLASVVMYYVCLQILLVVRNTELSAYQGINSFDSITLRKTLKLMRDAYLASVKFMFYDAAGTGEAIFVWLYRSVICANVILCGFIACKTKLYRKFPMLLLALFLLVVALPLSVHAVAVLGQNIGTHWMMKYPFVLMFIAMIVLLEQFVSLHRDEKGTEKPYKQNIFAGIQWLTLALSLVLIFNWFLLANQCYQKMRYVYEAIYAKSIGLVDAIYQDEDYTDGIQVVLVGNGPYLYMDDPKIEFDMYDKFTGFDNTEGVFYNENIMYIYWRIYLGTAFNTIPRAEFEAKYLNEINSMSVYPGKDSIQNIDGVLVVKVGETAVK